ncbi:17-beta-hydroxysteroid dehydrogenase 13 isoform X3 [Latimeria chalumnae]|uniref:17-beta-hydroxysteroid dehydrogenase 13 isoform X3 n=1 Tax=Latimeria chalumnae TaxID=7897 RepID=UPI00313E6666
MNLFVEVVRIFCILIYSYLEAFVKLFLPAKRKSVCGEIVLITGSAHGIGRVTALEFAKRQAVLVLWDLNKEGIKETADECKKLGATVYFYVVDCSKRDDIYNAAERVRKDVGDITILVNNAGVVTGADFLTTKDHQILKTFEVNILAHFWTTKTFLPSMMKNNHGHIVTVASAGGHFGTAFLVDYSSSKFAAVGFHEALTAEMMELGKDGIQTSCLCPFFVNTGFINSPKSSLAHRDATGSRYLGGGCPGNIILEWRCLVIVIVIVVVGT